MKESSSHDRPATILLHVFIIARVFCGGWDFWDGKEMSEEARDPNERVWVVTGSEKGPVNLKAKSFLTSMRPEKGLMISDPIWWIGYATNEEDAMEKCLKNLKEKGWL